MEREILFYWIALGLGIGAMVIGIIGIVYLSDYRANLALFQIFATFITIRLIKNPPT